MSYKLNGEEENPLWRNYMDNVGLDETWLQEIDLKGIFKSKSFTTYSEDDFLERLESDENFCKMWGEKSL